MSSVDESCDAACCAACGLRTAPGRAIRGFASHACHGCGHWQLDPIDSLSDHVETVYGDDYFEGGGQGYLDYRLEREARSTAARGYIERLVERDALGSRARVVDLGCAAGFTLLAFIEAGYDGIGLEPNERMAGYALDLGLDVRVGSVEHQLDEVLEPRPDLVLMIQLIAHLDRPDEIVRRIARRLTPGGHLLIETWNRSSTTARLNGRRWHELNPPSVRHWFTPVGLRRLCTRAGLEVVAAGRPARSLSARNALTHLAHALSPGFSSQAPARSRDDLGSSKALNPVSERSSLRARSRSSRLLARVATTVATKLPARLQLPYPGNDLIWQLARAR